MAEPLPPLPPLPALGDTQFFEKLGLHNAVAAMYRDAAINAQSVQMADNAAAVRDSTAALRAAHADAMASPTDKDRWWALMSDAYRQDENGIWRVLVGTDRLAQWANEAVNKSREMFPDPPPA